MNNTNYKYRKIRENILQIADEQEVYVTLVKGKELAILWDTGYGIRDLRSFVENNITTPYIVINSHGHPDHSMGNYMFDEIYISEADLALMEEYNSSKCRKNILEREFKDYEITEAEKELFLTRQLPQIKIIEIGQIFDLGGIHAKVIAMPGHTRGSIGLLLEEEKILLSGDAVNEGLWIFLNESLSLSEFKTMVNGVLKLPFHTYICGHSDYEFPKAYLKAHIKNIKNISVDESTKQIIFGIETHTSVYEDPDGKSSIVFAKDKL